MIKYIISHKKISIKFNFSINLVTSYFFLNDRIIVLLNHNECILLIIIVRTSFGLDSKTGLDSGPTSPNNKFVECGRKS